MQKEQNLSYDDFRSVLLLGEADFSFTAAFALMAQASRKNIDGTTGNNNDAAPTSTTAMPHYKMHPKLQITATEYGDANDIANRYFDGKINALNHKVSALYRLEHVIDVICGLNARNLSVLSTKDLTKLNGSNCYRWDAMQHQFNTEQSPFWRESNDIEPTRQYYDLIIFNFPHSDQAGRASKLVRALFKQLQICVRDKRLPSTIILEMRLRIHQKKNIRTLYDHEAAAKETGFECIGCWESDLKVWNSVGYNHKWTRKNESCRDMVDNCQVLRWTPVHREAMSDT